MVARHVQVTVTGTPGNGVQYRELELDGTPTSCPSGGEPNLTVVSGPANSGRPVSELLDGDSSTYWKKNSPNPSNPVELVFDMGGTFSVDGINWQHRQNSNSYCEAEDYEIYVSASTSSWGGAVASGVLTQNDKSVQHIPFPAKSGRFLRLVFLDWSSARRR